MSAKIVVRNLSKVFGHQPEQGLAMARAGQGKDAIYRETGMNVAVLDVDLEIREGEIFVIMGLSGSGKSTLVRLLNRLIDPTDGEVLVDGRDIARMNARDLRDLRRHDIAMVFQSFALMPHLSVLDNAAYGLKVAGVARAEREEKALAALDAVGLKCYAASYPDELSGGMKQRVGLARALAIGPSVLLMDEAFSALDPLIRCEMQDELLRLQEEQARTIVFISHDLDEALRIGDRIAIMQDGRVVQVGCPDEILKFPANDYVASFFRNVDITKVFTAGDIAERGRATILHERTSTGLRSALQQLRDQGRDVGVAIGRGRIYHGMVTPERLAAALKNGHGTAAGLEAAFLPDLRPLPASTPIPDAIGTVADSPVPLPVVDDQGRYVGVISKGILLHALDRRDTTPEPPAGPPPDQTGGPTTPSPSTGAPAGESEARAAE